MSTKQVAGQLNKEKNQYMYIKDISIVYIFTTKGIDYRI